VGCCCERNGYGPTRPALVLETITEFKPKGCEQVACSPFLFEGATRAEGGGKSNLRFSIDDPSTLLRTGLRLRVELCSRTRTFDRARDKFRVDGEGDSDYCLVRKSAASVSSAGSPIAVRQGKFVKEKGKNG